MFQPVGMHSTCLASSQDHPFDSPMHIGLNQVPHARGLSPRQQQQACACCSSLAQPVYSCTQHQPVTVPFRPFFSSEQPHLGVAGSDHQMQVWAGTGSTCSNQASVHGFSLSVSQAQPVHVSRALNPHRVYQQTSSPNTVKLTVRRQARLCKYKNLARMHPHES